MLNEAFLACNTAMERDLLSEFKICQISKALTTDELFNQDLAYVDFTLKFDDFKASKCLIIINSHSNIILQGFSTLPARQICFTILKARNSKFFPMSFNSQNN